MSSFAVFYYSPNIIKLIESRRMTLSVRVVPMEKLKNAYKILVGKPATDNCGTWCRREGNIKFNLRGCQDVNWIHLGWDRVKWRALVNTATNFRVS
jgi:hypothetical protein